MTESREPMKDWQARIKVTHAYQLHLQLVEVLNKAPQDRDEQITALLMTLRAVFQQDSLPEHLVHRLWALACEDYPTE